MPQRCCISGVQKGRETTWQGLVNWSERMPVYDDPAYRAHHRGSERLGQSRLAPNRVDEAEATAERDARLYTLPEAAAVLDRAEVTMRRWVRKGLLPFIKINGRYYIEREALRAFLHSHTHPLLVPPP
jgi:excisionase family DNA binding protein